MRVTVSAWDPGYAEPGEYGRGEPELDLDAEMPAARWRPLSASRTAPQLVRLVDGIRRIDARVELEPDAGPSAPGLCASYAAGAVCCDFTGDQPKVGVEHAQVERGLFSPAADAPLSAGRGVVYAPHRARSAEPGDLLEAVQDRMGRLEAKVSQDSRPSAEEGESLLVLDGALRGRENLDRAVGYLKSHRRRYLPPQQEAVVDRLEPGQRTPVFGLRTSWARRTWYLRLPGTAGAWAGAARLEASAHLPMSEVTALAEASAAALPALASAAHKDPRSPQNLTPIAGLERRLRSRLGDQRLLLRGLRAGRE